MTSALVAALLFSCAGSAARAEQPLEVRRGDLALRIPVSGTVVAQDVIRLKSTIDGRVEDIFVSTWTWARQGEPLGHLANKEMAALLDAHSTTAKGILEERWRQVYKPTAIVCPKDCFVMRAFVKPRQWLTPKAVLFEASQDVRLVAHVPAGEAAAIRDGQPVEFWDALNPGRKQLGRVAHLVLDLPGEKATPGGTFWIEGTPDRYLPPGTRWEGAVIPLVRHNALIVPTNALIDYGGSVYLPVKVSTGVTSPALTEITAGVEEKRGILVLDDSSLKAAVKHRMEADPAAMERQLQEDYLQTKPRREPSGSLPDPDAVYGEDPYGQ